MISKPAALFVLLLLNVICARAQFSNQGAIAFADSLMKAHYAASDPGAVLLIAKDGKPLFEKGYGLASLELNVADQPQNIFAVGSMTKQFTAVAILQLEQRGLLSLSDDIRKYLPDFNTCGEKVTIENLLSHTGGLVSMIDIKSFKDVDGKKEAVVYDTAAPLLFKPSSAWSYSNTGYFLLGLIVQQVSGISYEEYVRRNIFGPLHMAYTYFGTHEKILPGLAGGYDPAGPAGFKPTPAYSWAEPYSVGGMISNINDLLKWDEALYGGKLLNPQETAKAFSNYRLSNGRYAGYGYGWAISNFKGVRFIHHGGQIGGYLSYGIRVPSKHLYVVILSNSTKVSPDIIATPVALRLSGVAVIPVTPPLKVSPQVLLSYAGVYQITKGRPANDPYKAYNEVHVRNDSLFLLRKNQETLLLCKDKDEFYNPQGYLEALFHRNDKGSIIALELIDLPLGIGPSDYEIRTDLPFAAKKPPVSLTPDELKKFTGSYNLQTGVHTVITVEGGRLYIEAIGLGKFELLPESASTFTVKGADASVEFRMNSSGIVKAFDLVQSAGRMEAKRVD